MSDKCNREKSRGRQIGDFQRYSRYKKDTLEQEKADTKEKIWHCAKWTIFDYLCLINKSGLKVNNTSGNYQANHNKKKDIIFELLFFPKSQ